MRRETDLIIAGFNNKSQAALSAQKTESDRLFQGSADERRNEKI
jgi:hypothetical protein